MVDEIKNKRQLRRLVVLPYDLEVKTVFPESIQVVTEFAKKTGDYPSLSATDIKVMALTYQLEKEKVGVDHLRKEPVLQKAIITTSAPDMNADVTGFFIPGQTKPIENHTDEDNTETSGETDEKPKDVGELAEKFGTLQCEEEVTTEEPVEDVLVAVDGDKKDVSDEEQEEDKTNEDDDDDDDEGGWITPSNVKVAKKQVNSELMEEKHVSVACMTTDFAMQNVLKQMNLNVSALDGRIIRQLRTFILRCYTCFKTTSVMTHLFCPKCGNNTLKKVAVSLDENGKMQIHINVRRPLSGKGKKFSVPKIKGGKHPNNPILVADQPMPENRPSRLARMKTNPMEDDYIAGFSPFVMRDVNSKSAQLCIRPGQDVKYWMSRNPNEIRRKKKWILFLFLDYKIC